MTNAESIDASGILLVTFDCYGTLIDWESGIARALQPVFDAHDVAFDGEEVIGGFGEIERVAEDGEFASYREVLRRVLRMIGERYGFDPSNDECDTFAASVGDWPAHADTPGALARLGARFKLGVLSNVDDDLFALTRRHLGIEFDHLVTAEQVRAYKPDRAHFREVLGRAGLGTEQILHVAESRFHDIEPAAHMGFRTVWVDRARGAPSASGSPAGHAEPGAVVHSLDELADRLGA